ncbi:universal stress protein [Planobispora longispora]|uniref:UspA domain-containing protein n=1 Tax=Planobispora longispora TaxID=28887 RepID=A0A8J3RWS6_9ACTN|nr:universal stress protein [Planobispora longispora]BFE78452.1 hypothetical protein GCM10020093_010530 [Planobispora longispora]GIH81387.1 hypothetical protein Plo01_78160 [Planobispora longispora]
MSGPIVVGVDGSRAALAAVEWAVDAAARHGRPLRIVHVVELPRSGVVLRPRDPDGVPDAERAREFGGLLLRRAAELARERRADVEVDTGLLSGDVMEALRRETETAARIVLGSHGLGGSTGLPPGSVAREMPNRAHCPVTVVRPGR